MPEPPLIVDGRSDDGESTGDGPDDVSADPHCRYLLQYLRRTEGPASVETIARHVVAEITDTTPERAPEDIQRRVGTWFHHGQLPALDARGFVEFDPESGTVRLADDAQ